MPCKAPAFWWQKPGLAAHALRPASTVYSALARVKRKLIAPYQPLVPVICVGNAVAGGAGKTPATQALMNLVYGENISRFPAIVLRGYGGKLHGPTTVDPNAHNYKDVGDEALMHAACAPTIVARDRAAGVKLAQLSGADFIFMDDGLQNPSVTKTLSFLVVDSKQGTGNGLTLPAGPLRETLSDALAKTDAIILIGDSMPFDADKPVFSAQILPDAVVDTIKPIVAFAGLGRPEKFQETLRFIGANVVSFHAFPDHHPYHDSDIEKLIREADEKQAVLVTTEKDYMRISEKFRGDIAYFPVRLAFDDPRAVMRFIRDRLAPR